MKAELRFWGVRGSLGVGKSFYGSNTSCVELDLGDGHSIFFDAGSGIRAATHKRHFKKITLCLSHFHWDHIQGFPFITQLEDTNTPLEIVTGFNDVWERFSILFDARFHPVPFERIRKNIELKSLKTGDVLSYTKGDLKISLAPLSHPGTSYSFKVWSDKKSFVYATDSDYDPIEPSAVDLMKNADMAVMDSQFLTGDAIQKAHYGHSSFKKAIDTMAQLKIKTGFLFHFDPSYSDPELVKLEEQAIAYAQTTYGLQAPKVYMSNESLVHPFEF
ncbi:MAG: MBL fold metallo-hydrolase [Deltaproteobacteria bacterium]|nr:MBL fold metallo-hydrolase [Deltaproteobacteria bacterium]